MTTHDEYGTLELRLPSAVPVLGFIPYAVEVPDTVRNLDIKEVTLRAQLSRQDYIFPFSIAVAFPVARTAVLVTLHPGRFPSGDGPEHVCHGATLQSSVSPSPAKYFPALLLEIQTGLQRLGLQDHLDHGPRRTNRTYRRLLESTSRAPPDTPLTQQVSASWQYIIGTEPPVATLAAKATWRRYDRYRNLAAALPHLCELVQAYKRPTATLAYAEPSLCRRRSMP